MQAQGGEERNEYERGRAEVLRAIDLEEGEAHTKEMREIRNATIEAEVETRRTRADRDRVAAALV